ncbi:MAG: hypothetical protein ACOYJC_06105 [Christensenellales bacterium]|jgi:hypothetical protein
MKKILSILLLVVILLSSFPVQAAPHEEVPADGSIFYIEDDIGLCNIIIRSMSANLTVNSGVATCDGSANTGSSSHTIYLTMTLNRLKSGDTTWRYYASWTGNGPGVPGIRLVKTKALESGYYYRLSVTASAYSGGTYVETVSLNSVVRWY